MIKVRKSADRGHANHGWLDTYHTFSFGDYQDPEHSGFSKLLVINEDRIEGGAGFATHGHRDMEIISYVISGAVEHKDSMGNSTIIKPHEVQRMSAGTGIRHSEHNHFSDQKTHFLQIWVVPNQAGLLPGYGQKSFEEELLRGDFVLVASESGRDGSIAVNQDVEMYISKQKSAGEKRFELRSSRRAWIQMVSGELLLSGKVLYASDGAAVEGLAALDLSWKPGTEFLLFDLP